MDSIKGTLCGVVEQVGIRVAYLAQGQGGMAAELPELPDKMRLVGVTALTGQLGLIGILRIMLQQFQ